MKIEIRNLGVIKQAEFELGDMTIICGENNTGKTYLTYALFGFLEMGKGFQIKYFKENLHLKNVINLLDSIKIKEDSKIITIDIKKVTEELLSFFLEIYKEYLPKILSIPTEKLNEVFFDAKIENLCFKKYNMSYTDIDISCEDNILQIDVIKTHNSMFIYLTNKVIKNNIILKIISAMFPRTFLMSSERTGAAMFRKELNFARSRLLEEISQNPSINPRALIAKAYQDYPLPIKNNIEFLGNLDSLAKNNSFIQREHPEILKEFADIIGGNYKVTENDELHFVPKGKQARLTMDESSSAVRSLLYLGFYLKHVAEQGDMLMIDEPELNLHPANQRRIARLLARLINLGIKIFITTHSDYIIKELNTLIMLNHDKPHLKKIAEKEGYKPEELITAAQLKVYVAKEALIKLDGAKRKTRHLTLVPAEISPELGVAVSSFDDTIEEMNRIQESIVWWSDEE